MEDPRDAIFHLIIFDAQSRSVLIEELQSRWLLPVMCRPLRCRVPLEVQAYLGQVGLRGTVGGVLSDRYSSDVYENKDVILWIATHGGNELSSTKLRWLPVEDCKEPRALLPFQGKAIGDAAPWRHPSFRTPPIDEIRDWTRAHAAGRGRRLNNEFSQLRNGSRKMLLRFPTENGPPVFFFSGSTITSEAEWVSWLASRHPTHFPKTLGYDPLRSYWLIDTVPGTSLSECLTLENCKLAVSELAKVQVSLVRQDHPRTADPAREFRLASMAPSLDEDFEQLRQAYQLNGGGKDMLNGSVLCGLRAALLKACELEVPETFVHFDCASSNVFLEKQRIALIDFETAGWGFPFLSIESFLCSEEILLRRNWTEDLKRAYSEPWREVLTERQLTRAMSLVPIIRIWRKLQRLMDLTFESEPDRYWRPALYQYMLSGFTRKLVRQAN